MFAVAYYRRSTTLQHNSLEVQEYQARKAAVENNLIIEHEFIDDAISARKVPSSERPQLTELLAYLEKNPDRTLLVYKRDRLSREAYEYLELYQNLKKSKIKVIFTSSDEIPVNYKGPDYLELMIAAMNQKEVERINQNIQASKEAKFRNGSSPGKLPFGYKIDEEDGKIIPLDEELKLVKQLYDQLMEGKTLKEIISNAKASKFGQKWTQERVKSLIQNPTYMGIRQLKTPSKTLEQEYANLSIIDEETWNLCNEKLESMLNPAKKNPPLNIDFPLNGLLFCHTCDSSMIGRATRSNDKIKAFYSCPSCKHKITKKDTESLVFNICLEHLTNLFKSNFLALVRYSQSRSSKILTGHINKHQTSLEKQESKIHSLTESWLELKEGNSKSQIEANLEKAYSRYMDLRKRVDNLKIELAKIESLPAELQPLQKVVLNYNNESSALIEKHIFSILKTVRVEGFFIDITLISPFSGTKEVLP